MLYKEYFEQVIKDIKDPLKLIRELIEEAEEIHDLSLILKERLEEMKKKMEALKGS